MLFEPAVAYRSANGVMLSWWLGDEAEDGMLEIVDAAGRLCGRSCPRSLLRTTRRAAGARPLGGYGAAEWRRG